VGAIPPHEVGFDNPVDPQPAELRAWAYNPAAIPHTALPPDWDLLVATDRLAATLYELAADPYCPARRFALHALYIYAAQTLRPSARASRRQRHRLAKLIEDAARDRDEIMRTWAHNCRTLHDHSHVFRDEDWIDGGLARYPRRLDPYRR
jgi:hypothetical protein